MSLNPHDLISSRMALRTATLIVAGLGLGAVLSTGCASPVGTLAATAPAPMAVASPTPTAIPDGPLGDSIRLGQQIIEHTPQAAAAYVGNQLNCADCHLDAGTRPGAGSLSGVSVIFPLYNPRSRRVITLADRVEQCFVRSENGRPVPYNSPTMVAILAYLSWLARGRPMGGPVAGRGFPGLPDDAHPDPRAGAAVYASQCAVCHGRHGTGQPPVLPPLWGPGAYNDGAGMNQIPKMAAFVAANMPQNHPGSLTPQQAFDVAAFVHAQPHPKLNPAYAGY